MIQTCRSGKASLIAEIFFEIVNHIHAGQILESKGKRRGFQPLILFKSFKRPDYDMIGPHASDGQKPGAKEIIEILP